MKIIIGDDVKLDSPEEALFWSLCLWHGVPVIQNAALSVNGEKRYVPGFSVPEAGRQEPELWIEVSSGQDEDVLRYCRKDWRDSTRKVLVVLYREELDFLRKLNRPAQFIGALKALAARSAAVHR